MPLVDMHDLLNHAYRNHYAVGSFRANRLDTIRAIVTAAELSRSPVILDLSNPDGAGGALELTTAAAERAARQAAVPIALLFEGGRSLEAAVQAINLGCNGIRADAAEESFPANVAHTRRLAEMAHACGVAVEGELGHPGGTEADPRSGGGMYTSVEEARAFVQRTRVDCLKVYVGTGNGRVRGRLKLDVERVKRIHEAVQIPLAMRADNGFADEQCHRLLQHGVARVSFPALLEDIAGECLRANLRKEPESGFQAAMQKASAAMQAEVERCAHRLGSAGRAAEVLVQCRPWAPVQHVIVYNVEGADDAAVAAMMARGREVLATIPGVRKVITGWALTDNPQYRFCWIVEFVHAKVVDAYRNHPEHIAFANSSFRTIAGDRISIDFSEAGNELASELPAATRQIRA